MTRQITMLHDLPLGEPLMAEEIDEILRSSRQSPLLLALLQRMRDRVEGSNVEAAGLAYEEKPGVGFQLGAAAALREFAMECWTTAQGDDESIDGGDGGEET